MLEARSISFFLKDRYLLEKMSLNFSKGVLYALLGPNGSGKSTLLKILSALWTPSSGVVTFNKKELFCQKRYEVSKIVSLVPQSPSIPFEFLASEMVSMGLYPHRRNLIRGFETILVNKALRAVGAWHLKDESITELSEGEKQMIYLARGLVGESAVFLLDEPTTSLDPEHQLKLWDLLQRLAKEGKIVVVATHDLAFARRYCTNCVILNHGQLVTQGAISEVLTSALIKAVFNVDELFVSSCAY